MKRTLLTFILVLSTINAGEGDITDFQLDNGLKVVVMEKHSIPVVAVQVWYNVGSHDEWDGIRGVAHLFEHMMFRGSENYAPEEHARLINEVGGYNNAFTSDDVTVYHETLPASELELALKLEAERMHLLRLNQNVLDTEREVVHEEERQRSANPINKLFLKFRRDAYPEGHPYSETPIGIMEQLDTVSVASCQKFYDMYYGPNNAVLVIVGDVDLDETKFLVEKHFTMVRPLSSLQSDPDLMIPEQTQKAVDYEKSSFDVPLTLMGFHVPGATDEDTQTLDVLSYILSNGESSRLFKSLVREKKIALFAGGFPMTMMGPSLFIYFAVYFPHVEPEKIEAAIMDVLKDVRQKGVTEEELRKARKQLLAEKVFERYSAASLGMSLGDAELILGDYQEYNREIEKFNDVTAEDVKRVANAYFAESRMNIMHISPENLSFGKRLLYRIASIFM